MKNGIISKADGDALLEMYKVFDINGIQRRPLTVEEMVLIFALGKKIQEGEIVSKSGGDE